MWIGAVSGALTAIGGATAGPQENGNTLALAFSTASEAQRQELRKGTAGKFYFFRYLRITAMEAGERDGQRRVRLVTVEPSSDMRVVFTVDKPVSLEKAQGLKEGEAVAVSGSVQSMGEATNTIALAQAVVRYRDRLQPKAGKELLPEVDPSARLGTDTSSGREVIKHGGGGK